MFDKILVPLDGSKRAEKILPYVENLAKRVGTSKVFLLGVIESQTHFTSVYGMTYELNVELFEQRENDARNYLALIQKRLQEQGIQAEVLVEVGPVANTIIEVADKHNVDLIAMASHGRTGLARVFYGSVAVGVMSKINRPLLIIRAESET